jgi:serine phosphatase RsbU (regulator of sigma subunit)
LKSRKREYRNNSINLEACRKVFLFTDGLTEATSIGRPAEKNEGDADDINPKHIDFESRQIIKAMEEHRNLPSGAFLDNMVKNLVEFRGSDKFEDDICMICVDV